MPTYVYACSACNTTFEADQRITEPPLDTCICGSVGTIKRVIQPVGIAFKGSGFHINDYSSSTSGGSSPAKTSGDEAAPEKSSSETSSEPAATSSAEPAPTTAAPTSSE